MLSGVIAAIGGSRKTKRNSSKSKREPRSSTKSKREPKRKHQAVVRT
jgi:hypothetical protein